MGFQFLYLNVQKRMHVIYLGISSLIYGVLALAMYYIVAALGRSSYNPSLLSPVQRFDL